MESIEDSMDPRAKKKHEEEHEDSKKERKSITTSYYTCSISVVKTFYDKDSVSE